MGGKRKVLLYAAIAIFYVLLLQYFFRDTIYYHTHTRVYAEPARVGTLPNGERKGVVLPGSAVIDGHYIYLLVESRNFGGDILLAVPYPVTVLEKSGTMCVVDLQAAPGSLVITAWDGELHDRGEVVTGR